MAVVRLGAVLLGCLISSSPFAEQPIVHLAVEVRGAPPCLPLRVARKTAKRTVLQAVASPDWKGLKVDNATFDMAQHADFRSCMAAAERYRGRYTDDQLSAFEDGTLESGMPIELALMVLGPPDKHRPDTALWGKTDPTALSNEARAANGVVAESATLSAALGVVVSITEDGYIQGFKAYLRSHDQESPRDVKGGTTQIYEDQLLAYQRGKAAYEGGDHEKALELWRPLAEAGNAQAKYSMADMYLRNEVAGARFEQGLEWLRSAANSNHPAAQYHLGYLLMADQGLPQDLIEAHYWIFRAADLGSDEAEKAREFLEERLTPDQLAEAQRRLAEIQWEPPERIWFVEPGFPELARVARIEGSVLVSVYILADGGVAVAEVQRCSRPDVGYENAALSAVRQWRYRPFRVGGEAQSFWFTVVIAFRLH